MRITNNIPNLIAQRTSRQGFEAQARAIEHLATGLRVSRARDDPAGLVGSELIRQDLARTRSEIRVLARIDAVLSVADGALSEVSELLLQAEGLAVQASNREGITDEEFEAVRDEFGSILNTIDRLADTSAFNGQKLFTGRLGLGFNHDSITIGEVHSNALGLRGLDLRDGETAQDAVREAINSVADQRGRIGSFQNFVVGPAARTREIRTENLAGMDSFIRDGDFAVLSSELLRAQILTQASTNALTISGATPRTALELLGGVLR